MPRPRQCRRVAGMPQVTYYKPRGIPLAKLQCVELTIDELEAIRLADLEHHYQETAAQQMHVSRQTFGRILDAAHAKVADALVHGKALSITGGPVEIVPGPDTPPPPNPRPSWRGGGRGQCRRRGYSEGL